MTKEIVERVLEEADYILKTKNTIREAALVFKVSKSTVHKDLHERLKMLNKDLFDKLQPIFINHIEVRHIHGGESTKRKYLKLESNV